MRGFWPGGALGLGARRNARREAPWLGVLFWASGGPGGPATISGDQKNGGRGLFGAGDHKMTSGRQKAFPGQQKARLCHLQAWTWEAQT